MKREYRTIALALLTALSELQDKPKLEPAQQRQIQEMLREMQELTQYRTDGVQRLIDADRAYKVIAGYYHLRTDQQRIQLQAALDEVPTVEARPTMEWIEVGKYTCKCSLCNEQVVGKLNYCPNCGASKRGDKK